MHVNHSVTGPAKCPIGKHDLIVQRAELNPKNAIQLVAVFKHPLSPSQPIIERKNALRPKGLAVASCALVALVAQREHDWQSTLIDAGYAAQLCNPHERPYVCARDLLTMFNNVSIPLISRRCSSRWASVLPVHSGTSVEAKNFVVLPKD
jgi:hypothetical protein